MCCAYTTAFLGWYNFPPSVQTPIELDAPVRFRPAPPEIFLGHCNKVSPFSQTPSYFRVTWRRKSFRSCWGWGTWLVLGWRSRLGGVGVDCLSMLHVILNKEDFLWISYVMQDTMYWNQEDLLMSRDWESYHALNDVGCMMLDTISVRWNRYLPTSLKFVSRKHLRMKGGNDSFTGTCTASPCISCFIGNLLRKHGIRLDRRSCHASTFGHPHFP